MNKKKIIIFSIISILFLISFYTINIYSNVFADIEQISDSIFSSTSGKIPDSIVSISSGYVVVIDKKYQKIYVFNKSENYSKVFEAPCSTGKNPGAKQVAGDLKTPNGIFFATNLLRNLSPSETYGSLAFTLDYPTLIDQRAGKDGGNIWIHGTTKPLLPQQSNGCVVLSDSDLLQLANFIYLNKTPIIISESINWVPYNYTSDSKDELEKILTSWNKAFIEKDIKKIDSLYIEGTEIKGKKREELHDKIKNIASLNKHFVLQPRDISIIKEGNNAVIIFDQIFDVNNENSFQGFYNKLILEKIKNNWYVVDEASPSEIGGKHLALAKDKQKESQNNDRIVQKEINNLLKRWLASWKSGDVQTYRDCYASDFRSKEMDLNAWISRKIRVRQNSKNIKIGIDNLQISVSANKAKAIFVQHYSSSILRSKGKKTLVLKKIDNKWKIYREIMGSIS
ncbi:MAG: L,D-transpeptidase family protein [Syntrophaceae bacterium]|nr:L,D-transpeptidase family protein [Syntrophaceae bacterium]